MLKLDARIYVNNGYKKYIITIPLIVLIYGCVKAPVQAPAPNDITKDAIWESLDIVEIYDPYTDSWSAADPLAIGIENAAASVVNDELFIAGGRKRLGSQYFTLTSFQIIHIPTGLCSIEYQLLKGVCGAAAGAIDEVLYIVGGVSSDSELVNIGTYTYSTLQLSYTLQIFHPDTREWRLGPPMPCDQSMWIPSNGACAVWGGKLYKFGYHLNVFEQDQEASPALFIYDSIVESWSIKVAPGWLNPIVGVIDGEIYIADISDQEYLEYGTFMIYDPSSDAYTLDLPLPTLRSYATGGVINGKFYIVGGERDGWATNLLEVYDPTNNTWREKTPMPTPRRNATAVAINGKLYVIGGNYEFK